MMKTVVMAVKVMNDNNNNIFRHLNNSRNNSLQCKNEDSSGGCNSGSG